MTELQRCLLCQKQEKLQKSHIIPKFAYSWHQKTGQGPLRGSTAPNKRIQDGYKDFLMCKNCENILSKWEKSFCENIFTPYQNNTDVSVFSYKDWLLKFSTSLSWRVLNIITPAVKLFQNDIQKASDIWRKFLLDEIPHPAEFQQHIILLDLIEKETFPIQTSFINRYLLTACDFDIFTNNKNNICTYTKIFKFIFIGIIATDNHRCWKINKINANHGRIATKHIYNNMPIELWKFIESKACLMQESSKKISTIQQKSITENISKNPKQYIESIGFKSALTDYQQHKDKQ